MKTITLMASILLSCALGLANADTTDNESKVKDSASKTWKKTKDVTKEAAEDTGKVARKTYREAKDETCKMVDGALKCFPQKVKHETLNAVDEAKDKSNDPVRKH